MDRSYNKLEAIIFDMIEHNDSVRSRAIARIVPFMDYIKEYQTVSYNPGRQCGKTSIIARNAGKNDLIVVHNSRTRDFIVDRFKPDAYVKAVNGISFIMPSLNWNIIWVDNASYLNKSDIDIIYNTFAGKCNLFVMLG